jgi:hypothetical protein
MWRVAHPPASASGNDLHLALPNEETASALLPSPLSFEPSLSTANGKDVPGIDKEALCYNTNGLSHYAMRIRRTALVYFYFTYLFHFAAHPSLLYDTYANPLPLPHSYLPFAQLP